MKVFVYGTLKRQYHNHAVMQRAQGVYVSDATLSDAFLVHLGGFPGLVVDEGSGRVVHGEVYEVEPQNMEPLHRLEGYDAVNDTGMYVARKFPVELSTGEQAEAFAYVWNSDHSRYPEIKDGNF